MDDISRRSLLAGIGSASMALSGCISAQSDSDTVTKTPQSQYGEPIRGFDPYVIETPEITLPYRVYTPERYKTKTDLPVILTLHGAGARGSDNKSQIRHFSEYFSSEKVQDVQEAVIVAPQCPKDGSWVNIDGWSEGAHPPRDQTKPTMAAIQALDAIISEYNIDSSKQYAAGFSMGGYGTWDVITRYPERFDSAIPMSGGGIPELAEQLDDVRVWAFHGSEDQVVPVSGTREMIQAMRKHELQPKYTEFDRGHSLPEQLNTLEIAKWLFK